MGKRGKEVMPMVKHRLKEEKRPVEPVGQKTKFNGELIILMLILATFALVSCVAAADNSTVPNIDPNLTIVPTTVVTTVPTTIVVTNVTTVPITLATLNTTTIPTTVFVTNATTVPVTQAPPNVPEPVAPAGVDQFKGAIPKTGTGYAGYNAVLEQAFIDNKVMRMHQITTEQRIAAANNAAKQGLTEGSPSGGAYGAVVPLPGGTPDYFGPYSNYALSQLPTLTTASNVTTVSGGIVKFVDSLPGLTPLGANNIGQYIPVASPDTVSYPNADYYVIATVQWSERMSSNFGNNTTLREYVQLETPVMNVANGSRHIPLIYPNGTAITNATTGLQEYGFDVPHFLGPLIQAQKDKPVRIQFHNYLPTGTGGDMIIPTDTTLMGAGVGPNGGTYTQNRATLHLHGGNTPWISDGTQSQWTVPANENTPYPKGVTVGYVPDMDGGSEPAGTLSFYYTNQQSARLMFYHEHAYGITRLGVMAGQAAGYIVRDSAEGAMIATGALPSGGDEIPLIIQDRTFVPNATQMQAQDPTWPLTGNIGNITAPWPRTDDIYYPHVYMPAQNPADITGVNAMGRWDYGPWVGPPFQSYLNQPLANPYVTNGPWEFAQIPGTPNPSQVPETFLDTPIINGNPYPTVQVGPHAYRFRILNAANERFFNLQWYYADPLSISITNGGSNYTSAPNVSISGGGGAATANATIDPLTGMVNGIDSIVVTTPFTTAPTVTISGGGGIGASAVASIYTEVRMVPALPATGLPASWPTDGRAGGVPDPTMIGPSWYAVGTEGGFLPAVDIRPTQPVVYDPKMRSVAVTPVLNYSLLVGPAERSDVVVDFTGIPNGAKLILYNDAPAPFPGFDTRYDFYTNDPNQTAIGGAPTTLAGYGPNTRTLMQVTINSAITPTRAFPGLTALQTQLSAAYPQTQDKPIIPEAAYNAAFGTAYTNTYVNFQDPTVTFTPAGGVTPITKNIIPKSVMEGFDMDYGRITAQLGAEIPRTPTNVASGVGFSNVDPPTEVFNNSINGTLVGTLGDGTQIWMITHNGVDTHVLHWHMFNLQVINRVFWDGTIVPPDPNEVGWKESVRINALQNLVVAMRPIKPVVPWEIPNSIHLLDVANLQGTAFPTVAIQRT